MPLVKRIETISHWNRKFKCARTYSRPNENGLTNGVKITYVSQAQGDRLILANTNGWTWLGFTAGFYRQAQEI